MSRFFVVKPYSLVRGSASCLFSSRLRHIISLKSCILRAILILLFAGARLHLVAQTPAYKDQSFTYFDFEPPQSKKAWLNRQKSIRATVWKLFGDMPPALQRPVVETLSKEKRAGYTLEHFRFHNGVDAEVTGYLLIPEGDIKQRPAVLYHHYHGGDYKMGKEELFKKNYVNSEGPGEGLVKEGYVVMAIDAYGFGERQGKGPNGPKEMGKDEELTLQKNHLWKGRCLWGMIVRDDQTALNYLCSRPEVDTSRIATMGLSMGCLRSFWLAALDERIRATVAVSCLVRNQELYRNQRLNGHGIYYYVPNLLRHFDNESIVACIAPRPLLTLSGAKDGISPLAGIQYINQSVEKVYGVLGASYHFKSMVYPEYGHEFNPVMWAEAVGWLNKEFRNYSDKKQSIDSLLLNTIKHQLAHNQTVVLNIKYYYDGDEFEQELIYNTILHYLKTNPTISIELRNHTDCRGDDKYNKQLSQRRAENLKKWLTERGIAENRITPIGLGEEKPLVNCENCKCREDVHGQNRRIEMVKMN